MILALFASIFLSIFLFLILFQFVCHLLDQDRDAKYAGIYTVAGPYYQIKYYVFLLLLKIRKYRKSKTSKIRKIFDVEDKRVDKLNERPQDLDEKNAIDSVYFYCGGDMVSKDSKDPERVDVIIRMARRKGRVSEFWMVIKRGRRPTLVHPSCPQTTITDCSRSGWKSTTGLLIQCDRPNEKWTIKYHGWLKEETREGRAVHVNIKLCFRSFSNIVDSHMDTSENLVADSVARERWTQRFFELLKNSAEKNQTHYEQWGSYTGTINIDREGEHRLMHGKGYRDHSFGIRNWSQYVRYGALFGYLENGACFSLGSVSCRNSLSHIRYGYFITPYGDTRPITHHNFNLWEIFMGSPPKTKFVIEFFAGEKYHMEVNMSSETNFNVNKGESIIIERFVKCQINNIPGKGVNEFCASDAVPSFKQENSLSIEILRQNSLETSNRYCLSLNSEECRNRDVSGGKGCQLADLLRLNRTFEEINVPPGFVLTIQAYKEFLKTNAEVSRRIVGLLDALKRTPKADLGPLCREIESSIENGELPNDVITALRMELVSVSSDSWDSELFAIRSSTADEDSSGKSSAGQMATYLGVRGFENICLMIKKCWASQFTPTAAAYRLQNGQPLNAMMAVVIMKMIPSNTSGVLFTMNPVNGDSTKMILNATRGLGESIVSGKCEPDTIEIERLMDESLRIAAQTIGTKSIRIDLDFNVGETVESEGEAKEELCISNDNILKLAKIGALIEKSYGEPCDIEWAECGGLFYILQTRPITNWNVETDEDIIQEFDSALAFEEECLTTCNIGEMMPMATTPLTWSLFASAIDKTFQISCHEMGVLFGLSRARRFICSFSNHLFINIHCMSLLSDLPELDTLFVSLLGRVVDKPSKKDIKKFVGVKSLFRRITSKLLHLKEIRKGQNNTKEWERKFQCGYRIQPKKSVKLQMEAIVSQINDYFLCWCDTTENTTGAAMWSIILMRILKDKKGWSNDLYAKVASLLRSCSNVVSADVPNSIKKIAITIGRNETWKNFLLTESEETCLDWLSRSASKEAGERFREFLEKHGHRCIREAEFQEDSWKRSPKKLVSVIKALVLNLAEDDYTIKCDLSPEMALKSLHLDMNFIKRKIVEWVLVKSRSGVGQREWGKSIAIQMCEAFKQSFNKLAELMVQENWIPDANLIYFFTFDELISVIIDGDEKMSNILFKVQRRKRLFETQSKMSMPEICFGYPYDYLEKPIESDKENGRIKFFGTPVSVGRVSGTCRVVLKLEDAAAIKPGDILIVPYTDVGWTPYFPLLGGLITEKGSVLSHGAVVAREYGLPCLVGCSGATKIFETGTHVLLNASEGFVETVDGQ